MAVMYLIDSLLRLLPDSPQLLENTSACMDKSIPLTVSTLRDKQAVV